ncbi:MAG: ERF family protein [Bacteroidales bacterium]|jgi:hypothetical protein|nr:ERF family protein [Bacteroidales bacterium]
MEIYKKILAAKQNISMTDMKKEGWNDFSKYAYFTPDQINKLVFLGCQESELLTLFSLKRNQHGEYGELAIIDLETGEKEIITMATAIPSITATNAAQQLGGCVTYTERYLKMTAFGISDNTLDPDTSNNTKKTNTAPADDKKWLNKNTDAWDNVVKKLKDKKITMQDITDVYKMKKELKDELKKL